ncbi:MAG: hypothetical protein LV473_10515 [Nitrospira sp.]|nr:hypothetical protein [Nitrospira sp.]
MTTGVMPLSPAALMSTATWPEKFLASPISIGVLLAGVIWMPSGQSATI